MFYNQMVIRTFNGSHIAGEYLSTHSMNSKFIYVETKSGRMEGGIYVPKFHGPFDEAHQ